MYLLVSILFITQSKSSIINFYLMQIEQQFVPCMSAD